MCIIDNRLTENRVLIFIFFVRFHNILKQDDFETDRKISNHKLFITEKHFNHEHIHYKARLISCKIL